MRNRLIIAFGFLVALIVSGASVGFRSAPATITKENYDRIRLGMTRSEIEAILGPPGDYTTRPTSDLWQYGMFFRLSLNESLIWRSDAGTLGIRFNDAGISSGKGWADTNPEDHGVIGNLRWRLERQLGR
jgi:hypothetical protein